MDVRRSRRARGLGAAMTVAMLAVVSARSPASAAPVWQDGAVAFTNAVSGSCTGNVSSAAFTGFLRPNAGANPRAGTRFHLRVVVTDVSICSITTSISLKLPAGVTLAPTAATPVRCTRSDSSNPSNLTVFTGTADCPAAPTVVNSYLVLSPPSTGSWSLRPASDPAEDRVEIQVPVVATAVGTYTTRSRVCNGSGLSCTGVSPPGNSEQTVTFTVDPDNTPPAIAVKADVVVETVMSADQTTAVFFTKPTATDNLDGNVPTTCTPGSGHRFGYGTTPIACTAVDAAGNQATSSFNVIVRSPTKGGAVFDARNPTVKLTQVVPGQRVLVHVDAGAYARGAAVRLTFVQPDGSVLPLRRGRAASDGSLDLHTRIPRRARPGAVQVRADSETADHGEYDRGWFLTLVRPCCR